MKFQSSRPARGETILELWIIALAGKFQSSRPARGETGGAHRWLGRGAFRISILSPRTGRDSNGAHDNTHYHVNIAQI